MEAFQTNLKERLSFEIAFNLLISLSANLIRPDWATVLPGHFWYIFLFIALTLYKPFHYSAGSFSIVLTTSILVVTYKLLEHCAPEFANCCHLVNILNQANSLHF